MAKYAGASLEVEKVRMGTDNRAPKYLEKFPFGKVPGFECAEGTLFESNAISFYIASKFMPSLLGESCMEKAQVLQYLLSYDNEIATNASKVVYPMIGISKYDEDVFEETLELLTKKLKIMDSILASRTYLVGESITIADISIACGLWMLFAKVLETCDRSAMIHLTRWFLTVANQKNFKAVAGAPVLCSARVVPESALPEAAPSAAVSNHATNGMEEDEEEEAKPAPKAKNALDLLPPSKFNLEEWKRYYSNAEETRPDATNWFWNHYDPEGYSIWRADYMYNEELKKIFMTCNLITGLFHRMDAMRRYCFASVLVFGEDDANEISGMFVFRGQEIPEIMKEVPDFEVYKWTRVDTNDAAQRELVDDFWAWEGKLEGKKFNEGKVFK